MLPIFNQKQQIYRSFLVAIKDVLRSMIWLLVYLKAYQHKQQAVDRPLLVMVWLLGLIYLANKQKKKERLPTP